MIRALLAALGAAMRLFPARILRGYERVAFAIPDDATAEAWLPAAIRTEGVLYIVLAVVGGTAYGAFVRLVGARRRGRGLRPAAVSRLGRPARLQTD